MRNPRILVVGTYDTKCDELEFMAHCIRAAQGQVLAMDVGVLGSSPPAVHVRREQVASAGGSNIEDAAVCGDENTAMQIMARGASQLAAELATSRAISGVIILGGTMGTDLALDICQALPVGFPKHIVSTVAFSPLIPPARIAADVQMTLWAGGLYGLNSISRTSLSLASGAIVGAARAVSPQVKRPVIGMTSFGSSVLSYMIHLKPGCEARGFELAVFHATGMGGRAFDALAASGHFDCVMDFAPQEITNLVFGSALSAGESRMQGAGKSATPQIVAPGCIDLIDYPAWQPIPERFRDREFHDHNRLIRSTGLTPVERRIVVDEICSRIGQGRGPVAVILPLKGIQGWDREGQPFHDPAGLKDMISAFRERAVEPISLNEVDAHINDVEFAECALSILDAWCRDGTVKAPPVN